MDPNAAYREMCEFVNAGDIESAKEKAWDLKDWLDCGGFYPTYCLKSDVDHYIQNILRR